MQMSYKTTLIQENLTTNYNDTYSYSHDITNYEIIYHS